MKVFQLISALDGSRSGVFTSADIPALLDICTDAKVSDDDYVLILIEDIDSKPYASRAPLCTVRQLREVHAAPQENIK